MTTLDKVLILSGLFSFIVFLIVAIPSGLFMYDGYSHVEHVISIQGAIDSPIMTQVNILFNLFGIFMFLFGIGLYRVYAKNWAGRIGSILFIIAGISIMFVGFFPCDAGCIDVTLTAEMHQFFAEIPLIIAAVALVFICIQEFQKGGLGKTCGKNNPWIYIIILYLIVSVVLALVHLEFESLFLNQDGLWQRLAIGIPMSLMAIVSIILYKKMK
jgi:hypothetical protein